MISPFTVYLAEHFSELSSLAANVGRRKAKLHLVTRFWALSQDEKDRLARLSEDPGSHDILSDALEEIDALEGPEEAQIAEYLDEGRIAGIVVRTDYSDDAAWTNFTEKLVQAEQELASYLHEEGEPAAEANADELNSGPNSDSDEEMSTPSQNADRSSSTLSQNSLFAFLSPNASSPLHPGLVGASNLGILRLVNEVDVIRTPSTPAGTQRTVMPSGNRLTNLDGFVEAYTGPLIWVYDARSNADGAARVVSQRPDAVGSVTGDSWRARVSFLPELQMNLVSGAVKIDFGGLDRWSHDERQRNLAEANDRVL